MSGPPRWLKSAGKLRDNCAVIQRNGQQVNYSSVNQSGGLSWIVVAFWPIVLGFLWNMEKSENKSLSERVGQPMNLAETHFEMRISIRRYLHDINYAPIVTVVMPSGELFVALTVHTIYRSTTSVDHDHGAQAHCNSAGHPWHSLCTDSQKAL